MTPLAVALCVVFLALAGIPIAVAYGWLGRGWMFLSNTLFVLSLGVIAVRVIAWAVGGVRSRSGRSRSALVHK